MAIKPEAKAVRKPAMFSIESELTFVEKTCNNNAPIIAGIDRMNENSKAVLFDTLFINPPNIVLPDLDIPGNKAEA